MIEFRNFSERFDDFAALAHLNCAVNSGEFFGLPGLNGADGGSCMRRKADF